MAFGEHLVRPPAVKASGFRKFPIRAATVRLRFPLLTSTLKTMKSFCTVVLSGLVCLLIFAGCSESGSLSGLSKCEGTVTYKGAPVAEAMLTFHPDGGGQGMRAAGAITDSSGKFKVTTLKSEDGITPGNYNVTIFKLEEYGDLPPKTKTEDGEEIQPPRLKKNILPTKYEKKETSGLTAAISKSKEVVDFALSD